MWWGTFIVLKMISYLLEIFKICFLLTELCLCILQQLGYQKSRSLKEEHFIRFHDVCKFRQTALNLAHIRNQHVDDRTPRLEQKKLLP